MSQAQPQPQVQKRALQAMPRRCGGTWLAWLTGCALMLCAALTTPPAHAGRTDSDWMAPVDRIPLIDAPGSLERMGVGQPAQALAAALGAAHAAMVAEMRIATHEEAQALLKGGGLPGAADTGGGTATIAALLDRLSATLPSSATPMPTVHGVGNATHADLDCALFAESVRVRRLLGASDVHKPSESAGPASAMWLDVPIRCLATVPHAALPAPGRQVLPPAPDQGREGSGVQRWPMVEASFWADSVWLTGLAGTAVALVVFGLAARARDTVRQRARDKAAEQW